MSMNQPNRLIWGSCFFCLIVTLAACTATNTEPAKELPGTEVRVSPAGRDAAEPAIAADYSGNILIAYVEHAGKTADLFMQKCDSNGNAVGEPVRINPRAGEVKAWKGDPPSIAIGVDGTIFLGWTRSLPNETARGNDLVLSVSKDGGKSFGKPVKINDDVKPASHGMHSIAVDNNGRIFASWLDERNVKFEDHSGKAVGGAMHHEETEPNSQVYYSFSDDGGRTFAPNTKIASEVCPCCKTTVLSAADGNVYISWRQVLADNYRHIAVAHSNDGGQTFSQGVVVSDDKWQLNACPVAGAALVSEASQTLSVLWFTAGNAGSPGLYTASSTDGGKTFGARTLVDDDANGGTPVLLSNGGKSTAVFAGMDEKILSSSFESRAALPIPIAEGSVPAAVYSNGKLITSFTRRENGKSGVWLIAG